MDLDDFWWQGSLAKDVYQHLYESENRQPHGTSAKSKSLRLPLVHWILKMSRNSLDIHGKPVELGSRCIHLAVMLMDFYLDWQELSWKRDYYVLAGTCVRLAAKFEESDVRVPSLQFVIGAINSTLGPDATSMPNLVAPHGRVQLFKCRPLTSQDFNRMEMNLLGFVDYRLMFPTAPCFVPYFLSVAFATQLPRVQEDRSCNSSYVQTGYPNSRSDRALQQSNTTCSSVMCCNNQQQVYEYNVNSSIEGQSFYGFPSCFNTPSPEPDQSVAPFAPLNDHLAKIVALLLELSLQDTNFAPFPKSMLAASCVFTSRRILGFTGWTAVLAEVSGYFGDQLLPCVDFLLSDLSGYVRQLQQLSNLGHLEPHLQLCFNAFSLPQSTFSYNPLPSPPLESNWIQGSFKNSCYFNTPTAGADQQFDYTVTSQYNTPVNQIPPDVPPPAKRRPQAQQMMSSIPDWYDQCQMTRPYIYQSDPYAVTPAYGLPARIAPTYMQTDLPPANHLAPNVYPHSNNVYEQPPLMRPRPMFGVAPQLQPAITQSGYDVSGMSHLAPAHNTVYYPVTVSHTQDGQQVLIIQANGARSFSHRMDVGLSYPLQQGNPVVNGFPDVHQPAEFSWPSSSRGAEQLDPNCYGDVYGWQQVGAASQHVKVESSVRSLKRKSSAATAGATESGEQRLKPKRPRRRV